MRELKIRMRKGLDREKSWSCRVWRSALCQARAEIYLLMYFQLSLISPSRPCLGVDIISGGDTSSESTLVILVMIAVKVLRE